LAKIEWADSAIADLARIDRTIAERIVRKVTWLGSNFENIPPEPLSKDMKGLFKLRIGDWRAIYTLEDDRITIQFVGHRSDIYKRLQRS